MISFDGISRKYRFYRNALVTCFFLNVLCVITGLCLGVEHWHTALQRDRSQSELFKRLESADKLETAVQNLVQNSKFGKKDAMSDFENWSEVKIQLLNVGLEPLPTQVLNSGDAKTAYLDALQTELRAKKLTWMNEWQHSETRDRHIVRLLITISLLSLFFGLFIPLYCFARVARILIRTKDDLQKTAQNIVGEWLKAAHQYGEEPFRNFEFWLHIILVVAAFVGESSRHPAAQIAGELAHLIRRELKRSGVAFDGDTQPRANT